MKRTFSDIEATAASMSQYGRTVSPYDKTDPAGYKQIISAHSNSLPTNIGNLPVLQPSRFDGARMAGPVTTTEVANPRITNPARVYASFSVPDEPGLVFDAPRQYEFSFMLKALPVRNPRSGIQSRTQMNFNSNIAENLVPTYALNPYGMNMLWAILQHRAAKQHYDAYSEITPAILYHGVPDYVITPNPYSTLFNKIDILKNFFGWTSMDGVTMVNEPYSGRDSFNGNTGNTIFTGSGSTIQSYHSMAQNMKGIYMMHDYWQNCGTFPNAALYLVLRKYPWEKYHGHNGKDQTVSFAITHSTGQGFSESYERALKVGLDPNHKGRFKDDVPEDRRGRGAGADDRRKRKERADAEREERIRKATEAVTSTEEKKKRAKATYERTNAVYTQLNKDLTDAKIVIDPATGGTKGTPREIKEIEDKITASLKEVTRDRTALEDAKNALTTARENLVDEEAAAGEEPDQGFRGDDKEAREDVGGDTSRHRDHILPMMWCAVAVPDGGPLPREYILYQDEDGRERIGKHVFVGTLMRPSYFKDPSKPVLPKDVSPLMDMRDVNSKYVIHVRVDPDDSFHTVI